MAQIINFPTPPGQKNLKAGGKYKSPLCQNCKTTKKIYISQSKICYGIKRFYIFGKNICASNVAHVHVKCYNCGYGWVEE